MMQHISEIMKEEARELQQSWTYHDLVHALKRTRQECGGIELSKIADAIHEALDEAEILALKEQI